MQITSDPFAAPYQFWNRFYGTINGKVCSWSFTAGGEQSPLACEEPYQPRGELIVTPAFVPVTEPPLGDPGAIPTTVTPEPSTFLLVAFALAAIGFGKSKIRRK